jgi:hypothetical protein
MSEPVEDEEGPSDEDTRYLDDDADREELRQRYCSMLSGVFLLGPTVLHRFGERTARRDRLLWSIRLMVVGLVLLGAALLTALWGVARFVFGDGSALQLVLPVAVAMAVVWIVVPVSLKRRGSTRPAVRSGRPAAPPRDPVGPA